MTTFIQQILEMRVRMSKLADSEQGLIKELADVVRGADQTLLREVRSVAVEHEVRRGDIMEELRALSSRLGSFPSARESCGILDNVSRGLPPSDVSQPACGDWRLAAANIRDELEICMESRLAAG